MAKAWERPARARCASLCVCLGLALLMVSTLGLATPASAGTPSCPITTIVFGGPGATTVGGSLIETASVSAAPSTAGQAAVAGQVVLSGTSRDASVPSFSSTTFTLRFVVHPGETVNLSEDLGPAPQIAGSYEGQESVTFGGVCRNLFSDSSFGVVVTS